jgi:hypothetical protein
VPWPEAQESAEHTAMLAEDRRLVLAALAALPSRRREVLQVPAATGRQLGVIYRRYLATPAPRAARCPTR